MEEKESIRLKVQSSLDAKKSRFERNRLGQYATPSSLASEIVRYGLSLTHNYDKGISFLDPAIGTGSFYSALLGASNPEDIDTALGFEIDSHYGLPSQELWKDFSLCLKIEDFTKAEPPKEEADLYNLVICNPPYVRHQHIASEDKKRLQSKVNSVTGIKASGLSGLYLYFIALTHTWMKADAIAGWLIPSEFMDVNYGSALKEYLLEKVTLLRVHRFLPEDIQFTDALVSSSIVWFKNTLPATNYSISFSVGGSLSAPTEIFNLSSSRLRKESKWGRLRSESPVNFDSNLKLKDLFTIKRGIATGNNDFFILSKQQIDALELPLEVFKPILPSPRNLPVNQIGPNLNDLKNIHRLFLLDCKMPEEQVRVKYPKLWQYLETGKENVAKGYLCRSRKVWYFQEERSPAPIICTYMGRASKGATNPFRFILNYSEALATNSYLLLYPKPFLEKAILENPEVLFNCWEELNQITATSMTNEGRVYGGGLHKLEPKELANVKLTSTTIILKKILQGEVQEKSYC